MAKRFIPAFIFALLLGAQAQAKVIVIYHTSDVHGRYAARAVDKSTGTIGGFPALSALVKKEKNPYILLDSGDWYQGTLEGNLTKGMASVQMMNLLGYKASAIGNHEYDFGEDNLKLLVSSANFAVLGANIKNKSDGSLVSYAKPYAIVDVDGIKIGIIGIANADTSHSALPKYVENLTFENEAATAAALAPEVKKQGANTVIAIVHDGSTGGQQDARFDGAQWTPAEKEATEGTVAIARAAKGELAVILGGHSHVAIDNGYFDKQSGALIAESGYALQLVSRVEMTFDDTTGKFTGATDKLVDLRTSEIGEDTTVLDALKPIEDSVGKTMNELVATAEADIPRTIKGADYSDSPLGDLVCDIIRRSIKTEIVLHNTFGMRANLSKGPVTLRSIYEILPFENTVVTMELSGAQLEEMLRDNLKSSHSVIQESGMEVEYSLGDDGAVSSLKIKINGKPLDKKQFYTVATNNYLAQGGSGGRIIAQGRNIKDTGLAIRDAVLSELKTMPPLKFPITGRLKKI